MILILIVLRVRKFTQSAEMKNIPHDASKTWKELGCTSAGTKQNDIYIHDVLFKTFKKKYIRWDKIWLGKKNSNDDI